MGKYTCYEVPVSISTDTVVPKGISSEDLWLGNYKEIEITLQEYPYWNSSDEGFKVSQITEEKLKTTLNGYYKKVSNQMSLSDDSVTLYFDKEKESFIVLWTSESKSGNSEGIHNPMEYDNFQEAYNKFKVMIS